MLIAPRRWAEFQHYKDRNPPWIRLHRKLLDDKDFNALPPMACKVLVLLWLVASDTTEGTIKDDAEAIAFRLRLPLKDVQPALALLKEKGFFVAAGSEEPEDERPVSQQIAEQNGFGSRHISDKVKRAVWERDGGKCCACESVDNLEFDHKTPVSKGGNSEEENVQLLCRACNRKKRTKTAEQVATQAEPWQNLRTSETESDTEQRQKETTSLVGSAAAQPYKVPNCPHDLIAQAYAEILPALPQLVVLSDVRKGHLSARWKAVCADQKFTREQGLEWFREFFALVAKSAFLTGNGKPNRDTGRVWSADFDWLMLPTNFVKVVEGRYQERKAA